MTHKTTVFINDTHCGSNVGLMSDKAENDDGRKIGFGRNQEAIFEHWKECAKQWKNPDCIVMLGDLVDGRARYDNSTSVWTPNLDTQAEDFKRCLKYWGKPKKLFSLIGTETHTRDATIKVEEQIARTLGAEREGGNFSTYAKIINLAPDKTLNTKSERLFHITHHMGSTRVWMYRGTAPSRAMAMMMLNESHFLDRNRKIFGIVRAHVHHYWQEKSTSRVMQVLPCWQAQTPFGFKIAPETPPDIGGVRFTIHDDGTFEDEVLPLPNAKIRYKVHQG